MLLYGDIDFCYPTDNATSVNKRMESGMIIVPIKNKKSSMIFMPRLIKKI